MKRHFWAAGVTTLLMSFLGIDATGFLLSSRTSAQTVPPAGWRSSEFSCGSYFGDVLTRGPLCIVQFDRDQMTVTLSENPPEVPDNPAAARRARRRPVKTETLHIPLSDVIAFSDRIQTSETELLYSLIDVAGVSAASLEVGFITPANAVRPNRTNFVRLGTNDLDAAREVRAILNAVIADNESRPTATVEISGEAPGTADVNQAIEKLRETGECVGCNLQGANLAGADLKEANLEGANLSGANLTGANLNEAYLVDANLNGAKLVETELNSVLLLRASLEGADLTKADLDGANFYGANLSSANLTGAGGILVVFAKANLSNANLGEVKLEGVNFAAANLSNAVLQVEALEDYVITFRNPAVLSVSYTYTTKPNLCGATLPDGSRSNQGCPE